MILEFIIVMSIIAIAVFPALWLYDMVESHFIQSLIIMAYGLLCIGLTANLLVKYLIHQLGQL